MGPIIHGRRRPLLLLAVAAVALAAAADSVTAQPEPGGKGPDYFNPKSFNPTMAIVMVVLVTAFFLLGFFSIYLRRCAGPPLGVGLPGDGEYPVGLGLGLGIPYASSSRSRRRTRGLDRAVLESFPTMAFADVVSAHCGKAGGALECAVCFCEFDDGDTLRLLLPRCAHAFHADCIDAWLASHVTCPVCRAVLSPISDAEAAPVSAAPVPAMEQGGLAVISPVVPAAPPPPDQAVVDAAAAGEETEEQRVRREEAAELMRIGSVKRALRSKSGRRSAAQLPFPRSHTTGHSLAAPPPPHSPSSTLDLDSERYTLRLPEHVLREAVAAGNLRRSASVQAGGGGGGDGTTATRRGFAGGVPRAGSRSVRLGNNSGRWPSMSLLARTFSARLPVWGSARRGEADAPANGGKLAGDSGVAVEQCDGGACLLGAHV